MGQWSCQATNEVGDVDTKNFTLNHISKSSHIISVSKSTLKQGGKINKVCLLSVFIFFTH